MKKIVIIGGGFGGIYVARKLKKLIKSGLVEVTLINRTNYFLFTPLLHEVATGGLSPLSIAEPIREIFKDTKINFCQGDVHQIDFDRRTILSSGNISHSYDFLVLALGAQTNFHDISGAKEHSLSLKSLSDALKIRSKIIDSFEKASLETDSEKRKQILTFAVVGGGATGVELSGELSEFIFDTLCRHYSHTFCRRNDLRIVLISEAGELLTHFPQPLRDWALKSLSNKGVEVFLDTSVISVSETGITLSTNEKISSENIFWTAGVSPQLPTFLGEIQFHNKRISVDKYLMARGQKNVFVLGDSAIFQEENGKHLPMLAQVAVQQAGSVATNLGKLIANKNLIPFLYKSKGSLVSIGQWNAVGAIFGLSFSGRFAWWLWRTVYLFKFISWRKRLRIAFEWTINLFYSRDITKID